MSSRWPVLLLAIAACNQGGPDAPERGVAAAKPAPAPRDAAPAEPEPPRPYVGEARRLEALGPLTGLAERDLAFYAPGDFEPLPAPRPGEWLAEHPESGQSYPDFARAGYHRPTEQRRTLYLLPLSYPGSREDPSVARLAEFARAYFGLAVRELPVTHPAALGTIGERRRGARRQLLAPDILEALRRRLPEDAFLLIAITSEDLYPAPDWNFVFGQATLRQRVGVYSTARYHPAFYGSAARGPQVAGIIERRTFKLMAHEIGHMFGLEHCVYYRCTMNGSNGIAETDRSPLHLCPVCLRKLRRGAGFDHRERYSRLARLYRRLGLAEEAGWIEARLDSCRGF